MSLFEMAKPWLNVPFRLHGVDKNGCDCIGLVVGILYENGILSKNVLAEIKKIKYGTNLQKVNYDNMIERILCFFEKSISIDKADLLLIKTRNSPIHFLIMENNTLLDNIKIIHTTQEVGHVFITKFDNTFDVRFAFKLKKS